VSGFRSHGLTGKGIRIAIFDAGFPGYKTHPAFKHLRDNNQFAGTYDFISKTENVDHGHWHGTATLSCIAGKMDTIDIGLATGAELLLARTEYSVREPFSEEENWIAAVEWADKHGANIISSSLGYTDRRYFNYEMNGKKSLVAMAATIAAQKGMLVVNAAGNEGIDSWHFIDTPADADSVLTIGGTDPYTDYHISFSSFGPTADGRLKPNVSAPAEALVAQTKGYAEVFGTSFSTPLVAGFAACAWQFHRGWNNMELFNSIEHSGHLYPYFDYAHGFGIPQADKIIGPATTPEPTFDFVILNDQIKVVLREKYSYQDTENALGFRVKRNFYYKIEDASGAILNYLVLLADQKEMLVMTADQLQNGKTLTIYFEGYTSSLNLEEDNNEK
jgi:subtilisin family serine protease